MQSGVSFTTSVRSIAQQSGTAAGEQAGAARGHGGAASRVLNRHGYLRLHTRKDKKGREMQALAEVEEGENNLREGYYARTYGESRLVRGFRLTSDAAALLQVGEIGNFDIVDGNNDAVQHISNTQWTVRSQRQRDIVYTVQRISRRRFRCSCPDYRNGTVQCKHIKAVRLRDGRVFNTPVPTPLERYHERYGERR